MGVFQCSTLFRWGDQGWSEQHFVTASDSSAALALLDKTSIPRDNMLGDQSVIVAIRVSDIAIRGDSLVTNYARGTFVPGGSGDFQSDVPWTAWHCRLEGTDMHRRSWFSRGMPDKWWVNPSGVSPETLTPPADFLTAFTKWFNVLRGNGFGILGQDKSGNPIRNVVSVVKDDPSGLMRLTLDGAIVTQTGKYIRVYGGKSIPGLGGKQRVAAVPGPTQVIISRAMPTSFYYGFDATATALAPIVIPYTRGIVLNIAKKSVGRAFFALRGRRRRVNTLR